MPLPNFFIIGAGKCGTTSLSYQLGQHPAVFMSDPKEPHFFSINWDRGVDWYQGIFERAVACKAVGEASVTYTLYPEYDGVPERMAGLLGRELRFIYIVRNPVDRMLSHCRHDKLSGLVPVGLPYESMYGTGEKYFQGSCYASQLDRYRLLFSADSIKVVAFEDYVRDPAAILREIFRFLDVDPDYEVQDTSAKNVSESGRRVPGMVMGLYRLQELPLAGPLLRTLVSAMGLKVLVARLTGRRVGKPELSSGQYQALYEMFLPEIRRLSDMTGRDLDALWSPGWNEMEQP